MLKTKYLILPLFVFLNSYYAFSQITYSNYEKKQEELVSKSEPFDSIQNWKISSVKSQNRKYIGQRIYLPKNGREENPQMDIKYFTEPFLFTKIKANFVLNPTNTHYKKTNFFQSISSNIYKPFFYCGVCGDSKMKFKNSNKVQDKYYIITNVLYGEKLKELNLSTKWSFKGDSKSDDNISRDILNSRTFKDIREVKYNYDIVFELQDEQTNEYYYYSQKKLNSQNAKFILVAYFVKQKQLYKGENLISQGSSQRPDLIKTTKVEDKSGNLITKPKMVKYGGYNDIWKCVDVTILEGSSAISYILTNDKDETIALGQEIKNWKFEKDIIEQERIKKENNQKIQEEREKIFQAEKLKENLRIEKRKKDCIAKFGTELGEIIASNKLKIGMTKEMCEMSWGIPIWSDKTTTSDGTFENWYYGLTYSLHFKGNLLERIEE